MKCQNSEALLLVFRMPLHGICLHPTLTEPLPPVNELPSSCHSAQTSSCSIGSDDGKADEAEAFDTSSCGLSKTDMLPND